MALMCFWVLLLIKTKAIIRILNELVMMAGGENGVRDGL